ncbi:MAG: beta strand repeat-containing protein, partial [Thermoguttaceae bacterium]
MASSDLDGNFIYTPTGLAAGSVTIAARTRQTNPLDSTEMRGQWQSVTFQIAPNVAATVAGLSLLNDTGDPDGSTTDPTLTGTVSNDEGVAQLLVEYDHDSDGTADGYAFTSAGGQFSYKPVGLLAGGVTIQARAKEWDAVEGDYIYGVWTSVAYTLEQDVPIPDWEDDQTSDGSSDVANAAAIGGLSTALAAAPSGSGFDLGGGKIDVGIGTLTLYQKGGMTAAENGNESQSGNVIFALSGGALPADRSDSVTSMSFEGTTDDGATAAGTYDYTYTVNVDEVAKTIDIDVTYTTTYQTDDEFESNESLDAGGSATSGEVSVPATYTVTYSMNGTYTDAGGQVVITGSHTVTEDIHYTYSYSDSSTYSSSLDGDFNSGSYSNSSSGVYDYHYSDTSTVNGDTTSHAFTYNESLTATIDNSGNSTWQSTSPGGSTGGSSSNSLHLTASYSIIAGGTYTISPTLYALNVNNALINSSSNAIYSTQNSSNYTYGAGANSSYGTTTDNTMGSVDSTFGDIMSFSFSTARDGQTGAAIQSTFSETHMFSTDNGGQGNASGNGSGGINYASASGSFSAHAGSQFSNNYYAMSAFRSSASGSLGLGATLNHATGALTTTVNLAARTIDSANGNSSFDESYSGNFSASDTGWQTSGSSGGNFNFTSSNQGTSMGMITVADDIFSVATMGQQLADAGTSSSSHSSSTYTITEADYQETGSSSSSQSGGTSFDVLMTFSITQENAGTHGFGTQRSNSSNWSDSESGRQGNFTDSSTDYVITGTTSNTSYSNSSNTAHDNGTFNIRDFSLSANGSVDMTQSAESGTTSIETGSWAKDSGGIKDSGSYTDQTVTSSEVDNSNRITYSYNDGFVGRSGTFNSGSTQSSTHTSNSGTSYVKGTFTDEDQDGDEELDRDSDYETRSSGGNTVATSVIVTTDDGSFSADASGTFTSGDFDKTVNNNYIEVASSQSGSRLSETSIEEGVTTSSVGTGSSNTFDRTISTSNSGEDSTYSVTNGVYSSSGTVDQFSFDLSVSQSTGSSNGSGTATGGDGSESWESGGGNDNWSTNGSQYNYQGQFTSDASGRTEEGQFNSSLFTVGASWSSSSEKGGSPSLDVALGLQPYDPADPSQTAPEISTWDSYHSQSTHYNSNYSDQGDERHDGSGVSKSGDYTETSYSNTHTYDSSSSSYSAPGNLDLENNPDAVGTSRSDSDLQWQDVTSNYSESGEFEKLNGSVERNGQFSRDTTFETEGFSNSENGSRQSAQVQALGSYIPEIEIPYDDIQLSGSRCVLPDANAFVYALTTTALHATSSSTTVEAEGNSTSSDSGTFSEADGVRTSDGNRSSNSFGQRTTSTDSSSAYGTVLDNIDNAADEEISQGMSSSSSSTEIITETSGENYSYSEGGDNPSRNGFGSSSTTVDTEGTSSTNFTYADTMGDHEYKASSHTTLSSNADHFEFELHDATLDGYGGTILTLRNNHQGSESVTAGQGSWEGASDDNSHSYAFLTNESSSSYSGAAGLDNNSGAYSVGGGATRTSEQSASGSSPNASYSFTLVSDGHGTSSSIGTYTEGGNNRKETKRSEHNESSLDYNYHLSWQDGEDGITQQSDLDAGEDYYAGTLNLALTVTSGSDQSTDSVPSSNRSSSKTRAETETFMRTMDPAEKMRVGGTGSGWSSWESTSAENYNFATGAPDPDDEDITGSPKAVTTITHSTTSTSKSRFWWTVLEGHEEQDGYATVIVDDYHGHKDGRSDSSSSSNYSTKLADDVAIEDNETFDGILHSIIDSSHYSVAWSDPHDSAYTETVNSPLPFHWESPEEPADPPAPSPSPDPPPVMQYSDDPDIAYWQGFWQGFKAGGYTVFDAATPDFLINVKDAKDAAWAATGLEGTWVQGISEFTAGAAAQAVTALVTGGVGSLAAAGGTCGTALGLGLKLYTAYDTVRDVYEGTTSIATGLQKLASGDMWGFVDLSLGGLSFVNAGSSLKNLGKIRCFVAGTEVVLYEQAPGRTVALAALGAGDRARGEEPRFTPLQLGAVCFLVGTAGGLILEHRRRRLEAAARRQALDALFHGTDLLDDQPDDDPTDLEERNEHSPMDTLDELAESHLAPDDFLAGTQSVFALDDEAWQPSPECPACATACSQAVRETDLGLVSSRRSPATDSATPVTINLPGRTRKSNPHPLSPRTTANRQATPATSPADSNAEKPPRRRGRRLVPLTFFLLFALLGSYFLAGGPPPDLSLPDLSVASASSSPSSVLPEEQKLPTAQIQEIELGRRVAGRNPDRSEVDAQASEPDEATWRKIVLHLDGPVPARPPLFSCEH